jgi:tRNA(Arg) A34 adenosine deaminase TadA
MHTPIATPEDLHFMQLALKQAHAAAQAGEVPVGAVVVRAGQVIAEGQNSPVSSSDPTAHAEVNAMRAAAKALGNYRLDDCTLYVTLEPCAMCSGALLHARFKRVVFGATEPKTGAVTSVVQLLDNPQLNHQTQWQGGVLANECASVLKDFFEQRRQSQLQNKTPLREDALRPDEAIWSTHALPREWSKFETQWPSLKGLRLHWFDNRSPDAGNTPVTIYLHGLNNWSASHLAHLQSTSHAVALDLPGFGLSDKPKKETIHTLAWHVQVLSDFLNHISIHTNASAHYLIVSSDMQPLMVLLQQALPGLRISYAPSVSPSSAEHEALLNAPYPDRGHLAGQRALGALLKLKEPTSDL